MTEEQKRAKKYLDRYRHACTEIKYLEAEIESLRSQAENIKSVSAVELGWTGQVKKDKRGRKYKVMAPVSHRKPKSGNSDQEVTMCELADKSQERSEKLKDLLCLKQEIETCINRAVNSTEQRAVLKMRHLLGMTYEEIGDSICYTARHTSRIYYDALKEVGKKMEDQG